MPPIVSVPGECPGLIVPKLVTDPPIKPDPIKKPPCWTSTEGALSAPFTLSVPANTFLAPDETERPSGMIKALVAPDS